MPLTTKMLELTLLAAVVPENRGCMTQAGEIDQAVTTDRGVCVGAGG